MSVFVLKVWSLSVTTSVTPAAVTTPSHHPSSLNKNTEPGLFMMDSVVHHNPAQSTLSPVSSTRRRALRENETPAQRQKREKAAERQRRKRERDRHVNHLNAAMSYPHPNEAQPPSDSQPPQPSLQGFAGQESPEEMARKERQRTSARERQRKHRSIVKQRKMRALGIELPGEMMPGVDEFRINGHPQFPGFPPELGHPMNPQEPPFPLPPPLLDVTPGQNFSSMVFYAIPCLPFLKQQLSRVLNLSNEDFITLQPFIAEGYDQWERQRRMQIDDQSKEAGPSAPPFPEVNDSSASNFSEQPSSNSNPFRGRFQRPLVATPPPFRTSFNTTGSTTATTSTPTSTPGSAPPSDPIDPHLSGAVIVAEDGGQKVTEDADTESVVG